MTSATADPRPPITLWSSTVMIRRVSPTRLQDRIGVDGLDGVHVEHTHTESLLLGDLGRLEGREHRAAAGDHRDVRPLVDLDRLPDLEIEIHGLVQRRLEDRPMRM